MLSSSVSRGDSETENRKQGFILVVEVAKL